eukprot:3923544-Prymnesium_polylepis.2
MERLLGASIGPPADNKLAALPDKHPMFAVFGESLAAAPRWPKPSKNAGQRQLVGSLRPLAGVAGQDTADTADALRSCCSRFARSASACDATGLDGEVPKLGRRSKSKLHISELLNALFSTCPDETVRRGMGAVRGTAPTTGFCCGRAMLRISEE